MSEGNRFDNVRNEMEERKKKAMERSASLKTEVDDAINELKKSQMDDQIGHQLVKRFSEVSNIPGVGQSDVEALIQGFTQLDAKFNAAKAIENLQAILNGKNDEKREFDTQSKHKY